MRRALRFAVGVVVTLLAVPFTVALHISETLTKPEDPVEEALRRRRERERRERERAGANSRWRP